MPVLAVSGCSVAMCRAIRGAMCSAASLQEISSVGFAVMNSVWRALGSLCMHAAAQLCHFHQQH